MADTTTDVLGPWDDEVDGPNPDDLTPAEYWQDVADDAAYERWREEHHS